MTNPSDELCNLIVCLKSVIRKLDISEENLDCIINTLDFISEQLDTNDKEECALCGNYWGP